MVESYSKMLGKPMDPADHPSTNLPTPPAKSTSRSYEKDPWNYPFTGSHSYDSPYPQY
jgi:hypothetical protein